MRLRDALGRAVGYQLRALPPTVVGLGLIGAGVGYGLGGGTALTAVETARLAPAAALVVVGIAVVAVGRTAVRLDATAAAVASELDGSGVDEDDVRETVALAAERAVADSVDGATAEIEARVVDAVTEAMGDAGARDGADATDALDPRASESDVSEPGPLDSRASEPDALADATRRASERVESYLDVEDGDADVGEFRQLAEGAAVLDGGESSDSDADRGVVRTGRRSADDSATKDDSVPKDDSAPKADAPETAGDGAEILDADPDDPDLPDGGDADDAEIIDPDTEMMFGDDVRDPDGS